MTRTAETTTRPGGVTALSMFFVFGACMSFISAASLLFPGSLLEPMWRLNPRAHEAFAGIGAWAVILMCAVSAACAAAALGLWRGARWGHRLAFIVLAINLLGDIVNVLTGTEPRALVGVPIVVVILLYLMSKRVKRFFDRPRPGIPTG